MTLSALVLAAAATAAVAQSPACSSNEGIPGRFPTWPVTYDMRDSTIIQPCNKTGFLNASLYASFGVVSCVPVWRSRAARVAHPLTPLL